MSRDLLASRELAWRLFLRDLSAQYRQSYLGYLWVLLPPLAQMLVWVFLNAQGILAVGDTPVPYPVYVLTGVVLWDGFVASLNAPTTAVAGAAGMLSKINFPREAILVASFGHVAFNTTIRLLLLVGVFAWFGILPPGIAVLAPLTILSVLLLGFTLGLLLVPLAMLYQDVGRGIGLMTTAWFFLTPVIYPPPTQWPAALLSRLNPVSPLLITARETMTTGVISQPWDYAVVTALTVTTLLVGWVMYRLAMPHMIARMSA
jgi:lipopolysaccharide transport system permease protein